MSDLESKANNLRTLVDSDNLDKAKITALLTELKQQILKTTILTAEESTLPVKDRCVFRSVLESDAIFHVKTENIKQFALDIQKLKTCYFRETPDFPKSDRMPQLLSLYLVYLLTQNQIVDFNIELPLYTKVCGEKNKFLEYSTQLEEALVDNSFKSLFNLNSAAPSSLYKYFTSLLVDGARQSHADSIELAYKPITLDELIQILHFENPEKAKQFVSDRKWKFNKDGKTINFEDTEEKEKVVVDNAARYVDLALQISNIQ